MEVMAGLPWEVLFPRRIGVFLTGEMSGWTAPKDVILRLAGKLTVSGGTNAIIEYIGPGADSISCTGKATITNMGAEIGATTSVFPYDTRMARYLEATGRSALARLADANRDVLRADAEVVERPHDFFDRVVEIDLSTLEPHVVGPHSPDRARPISMLSAEVGDAENAFIDQIDVALIGSCTNSSYEDMSRAAGVARQASGRGISAATELMVTPGSEQVRATIERDGQMGALQEIDAVVLANACGPCIGQWRRERLKEGTPNTIVTSYNRNFPRRNDGRSETMNFIASPEIVVALSLAGRLSFNPLTDTLEDGQGGAFRLTPPAKAPETPENGFDPGRAFYNAPPDDGTGVAVEVDPDSERLQILEPFPAWDGQDIVDAPVLIKTAGKCTTDHISPAGPWLRYRGHLERFSENMFMGATNAHTGDAGTTLNVVTGDRGHAVSRVARDYKARGLKWVVVGDDNYGEGSSREHAALSPRLLGGAAVIVRSFASDRAQLRPDPRVQPQEAGPARAHVLRSGRLRPRWRGRQGQHPGLGRARRVAAGRVCAAPRGRHDRHAVAAPLVQRVAASLVPGRLRAEPLPPVDAALRAGRYGEGSGDGARTPPRFTLTSILSHRGRPLHGYLCVEGNPIPTFPSRLGKGSADEPQTPTFSPSPPRWTRGRLLRFTLTLILSHRDAQDGV